MLDFKSGVFLQFLKGGVSSHLCKIPVLAFRNSRILPPACSLLCLRGNVENIQFTPKAAVFHSNLGVSFLYLL